MAYRADIEIAVKGAQELKRLQDQISAVSQKVQQFNADAARRGVEVKSITNVQTAVTRADQAMRSAAVGTKLQKEAIDAYVKSLDVAKKAELDLARAIKIRQRELGITPKTILGKKGIGKNFGGAVSGAVIGGAFPLLFGQGAGAAAGGAVGGLVGGLAGPGGSFAGSLLGTLLGDIASKGQAVKQLAADIGFSSQQTRQLSEAFKAAKSDIDKFTAVIQNIKGLGLEIDDQAKAIQLVTTLTNKYGGAFEKVGGAITNALEQGKVSQNTLNQLTSQGIDIQGALATKYGVSRDAILKMAKDGDISVQTLINTLVDMGNKGVESATRPQTAMEKFKQSVVNLGQKIAEVANGIVTVLTPVFNWILGAIANIINGAARGISRIQDLANGGRMAQADIQAGEIAKKETNKKYGLGWAFRPEAETYFRNQKQQALKNLVPGAFAAPAKPTKLETFTVPGTMPSVGGGTSKKSTKDTAADNLRKAQELLRNLQQQNALAETKNKLDNDILKISQDYEKTLAQIAGLEDQSLRKKQETEAIRLRNQEINVAVEEHEKKINEELDKQVQKYMEIDSIRKTAFEGYKDAEIAILRDLTAQAELLKFAFESIGQSFSDSVFQVTKGATTIQQAIADMLSAISRSLFNYAAQAITTYIALGVARMFAGIPGVKPANYSGNEMGGIFNTPIFGVDSSGLAGPANPLSQLDYAGVKLRANGGPVFSGSPYIVGERGPELFVPGRSGTIVSNDNLSSSNTNVVVNVDATGSKVGGDGAEAGQLGRAIAAAVQQELIKQKRPGGLLN